MPQTLRYGDGATLALDLPRDAVIGHYQPRHGEPLGDVSKAVAAALDDPLDFPPFSRAFVPGDRVGLAIGPGVPQLPEIISGVISTLLAAEIQPADVTIVLPRIGADRRREVTSQLPAEIRNVEVVVHDPSNRDELAYLAASKDGHPIYINRRLCEADVVLPIGVAQLDEAAELDRGLFPLFSDEDTLDRFAEGRLGDDRQRLIDEANEATWLLGVQFALQLIPGPGDSLQRVLAGELHRLAREAQSCCESVWRHEIPRQADLVVASIEGGRQQQTWENFSRAVSSASRAVEEGGSIVICSDLDCEPTPAMAQAAVSHADDYADSSLHGDYDDPVLAELACARQRARVFLLSRLEEDVVEDLAVGYVAEPAEIQRLARQHESCLLLASAQHVLLTLPDP